MTNNAGPLRLGLIGAGPWGQNYIRTIAGMTGLWLSRLASHNPESPALVGPECEIDEDWRALIDAADLDGIIIATPPATHAEMTLAAIDAGLPVLVEKPMTLDVVEAETILARAETTDSIVHVDHIHLYSAAWEALRQESRSLGAVNSITAESGRWGPFLPDTPMLWDWGGHDVAMCIDLLGRVPDTEQACRLETQDTDDGLGEVIAFGLGFGDITASIKVGNLFLEKKRLFAATFENGALVYDDMIDDKLRQGPSAAEATLAVPVGSGTPLERAVRRFANAIAERRPDTDGARLGADVVRVLARLESSLR